jgi:hypothetical protein
VIALGFSNNPKKKDTVQFLLDDYNDNDPDTQELILRFKDAAANFGVEPSFSTNADDGSLSRIGFYKWEMSPGEQRVSRSISLDVNLSDKVGPVLTNYLFDEVISEFTAFGTFWDDTRLGPDTYMSSSILRTPQEAKLYKYLEAEAKKLGGEVGGSYRPDTKKQFQFHINRRDHTGRGIHMRRTATAGIELGINRPGFTYNKLTKKLCNRIIEEFKTLKDMAP